MEHTLLPYYHLRHGKKLLIEWKRVLRACFQSSKLLKTREAGAELALQPVFVCVVRFDACGS